MGENITANDEKVLQNFFADCNAEWVKAANEMQKSIFKSNREWFIGGAISVLAGVFVGVTALRKLESKVMRKRNQEE